MNTHKTEDISILYVNILVTIFESHEILNEKSPNHKISIRKYHPIKGKGEGLET